MGEKEEYSARGKGDERVEFNYIGINEVLRKTLETSSNFLIFVFEPIYNYYI